jgi:polar amino acid transport system substrate-binding protein
MKDAQGQWSGLSIELWEHLANKLELDYRFQEQDLESLLSGVRSNSLDAAVAAITVTAERERVMDFTHPFYTTGLGIAVTASHRASWLVVLQRVLSGRFLLAIGTLGLLLMCVGFLVWIFERRKNFEQFGGKPIQGIGSAFWWSAVTMTTVGYGDKAPRTIAGRLVALIWMFASIIIISSFTAAITSALTVSQLGSPIRGPADLPGVRVAAVSASTGQQYLQGRSISYQDYSDARSALQALEAEKVDAVVYDAPILRYLAKEDFPGTIMVLPQTFVRQDYAIAVPQGSPLRETLNRVLEQEIRSPEWQEIVYHYLGRNE